MADLRSVSLAIGRSCFVRCVGCNNYFAQETELISCSEILKFGQALRQEGINRLTICGGDPLSRTDIFEILMGLKELGFTIKLDTVGTPLLGDCETIFFGVTKVKAVAIAQFKPYIDLLGIPLDGSSQQIVELFRQGRPNLFNEQLEILNLLQKEEVPVAINTVVHKSNLHDLPNLAIKLSHFSNIQQWELFQFSPDGPNAFHNRVDFEISEVTFYSAINKLRFAPINFKLKPKTRKMQAKRNILVDSSGLVWKPEYYDNEFGCLCVQKIIGNIKNEADFDRIIAAIPVR